MPAQPLNRRDVIGLGLLTACAAGATELFSSDIAEAQTPGAAPAAGATDLAGEFARLEAAWGGTYAVEAQRLDQPGTFSLRAGDVLPTASAFKLFVLCELFRQAEEGTIDLKAPITWKPDQYRTGDGILRAMAPGQQLSIHNMAILMITLSDNIATVVLTELLGAEAINRSLKDWKLDDSKIYKGLAVVAPPAKMRQPVSSARDLCSLITRIYRRDILASKSCDEMIRILRAQRVNDMLPRYIPVGEDWGEAKNWIANKTGYGDCRVDVGLIHTATLTLSLALFFKPNKAPPHRLKSISDYPPVLAAAEGCQAVYDHFAAR